MYLPVTPPDIARDGEDRVDIFTVLRERDVLVHHPYDSFATSVEEFVRQASIDPQRARHQADAVPHLRRQPDRALADPRRRAGQAGRRARRAQGPRRRAGQHRVGPSARRGGRARRVRPRRPQDPHEDRARRARRAGGHPPLLPHRHRQLQLEDGQALRGPRAAHGRRGPRRRPHASCSTTSPATGATCATRSCSSPRTRCASVCERSSSRRLQRRAPCRAPGASGRRSTASSTPT